MASGEAERFDVLIVTAVPEEYAAVLAAGGGAEAWARREGSTGLTVAVRDFAVEGGALTIAVTQALGMGAAQAVIASAELLKQHDVQCLAMCGVCAGKRGDVALGDVILADRVWQYGTGKRKAETVDGKRVVREQEDIEMYRLHPPAWKQAAERFQVGEPAWLSLRPRSYEAQGDWILERVLRGADPVTDAASKRMCADLDKALARLWKLKLLKQQKVELTAAGKRYIEQLLLVNRDKLPKVKPLQVHVGPIASGSQVMADDEVFARLSASVRKVLGVEMEAAAIGALAHAQGLPYSVVMKAVMDHADADKSDNFKAFAARASAEVLIAFVRQHVPPRANEDDPILLPGTSPLPKKAGPAALLNARHQVVAFHGRTDVLGEMRTWCESRENVGARLIHAAGGMGKTRLAIELCRQMRERGWRAGFLQEGDQLGALMQSERPVLAVIDYAESRPELREMLKHVAGRRSHKALRLLLLARNGDEWWADLLRSDGNVGDLLRQEEPVALPSMSADREAIFREAVRAFGGAEGKGVVPSLADPRYERVLYVHAAALAVAKEHEVKVDKLMDATLDHEEQFWREQIERVDVEDMRRVVTALTLKGGVSSAAEMRGLVELICGAPGKKMAMLLRDLYPGRAPMVIGGLEPDLLGEALVWRALSREGADAEPYLDRVFEGAQAQAIRTGFTVLGRLSEDRREAAAWIARVLGRDVAGRAMEAFAATKTVGKRTAYAALGMVLAEALEREGTVELAERLERDLPHPDRTVSLREVGRWVLGKRLASLPEGMVKERARLLNNLGSMQSALGQREAALASVEEAVALRRKLAELNPGAFLHELAGSLTNLGIRQSALGQREAALASTYEAVALWRRLEQSRPGAFLRGLAMSLTNLSVDQSALGQREAALVSSQEAVDLRRQLAELHPEAFLPDLAMTLNNLGVRQSALGQYDAALNSTREAVDIRRSLAESHPEAFLIDLATSLNNLGIWQSDLGQHDAALASTQEAVAVYRKLAESRPETFLPDLATILNNLGTSQSALGKRELALASVHEAVVIYRKLVESQTEFFLPGLAMSLNNLGHKQHGLGQHEAALASTQEAVAVYRKLAESWPETFLPDLASSLNNLGAMQDVLGHPEAALSSAQEALEAIWPLFLDLPTAFEQHTGIYLNNLRHHLTTLSLPPTPTLLDRLATFATLCPS